MYALVNFTDFSISFFGGFLLFGPTVRRRPRRDAAAARWWRPRIARHCAAPRAALRLPPFAEPREPSSESVSCNFTKNPTVKQHCPPEQAGRCTRRDLTKFCFFGAKNFMCKLDDLLTLRPAAGKGLLWPQLESIDWEALVTEGMPIFNNQLIVPVGGTLNGTSYGTSSGTSNGSSEAEATVTASNDLDFESILEVEGFLENSVFEDEETCSSGSSSTLSHGSSNQGSLSRSIDNKTVCRELRRKLLVLFSVTNSL